MVKLQVFRILIADCSIEISTIYEFLPKSFKGFLTEKKPDVYLSVMQYDIEMEKQHAIIKNSITIDSIPSIAMLSLQRKIAEYLIEEGTILFHGAAISVSDAGYIFAGNSGIGKTTHIYKWGMNCPDMHIINGDKPFIRCVNDPILYSSPWAGKESLYKNISVPLKSIILMERAEDNYIEEITFIQAFPYLLQQTYRPEKADKLKSTLKLLQQLNGKIRFFRFQCNNFKDGCFEIAYNTLIGENNDAKSST